ncbi:helix-turn-helix transcriptional regulator [Actinosynnema sp. NPDC051121]
MSQGHPELSPTDYKLLLGELLADLRERAGLDRVAVAKVLKCSKEKIGTIERGRTAVNASELEKLLQLFGVPAQEWPDIEKLADAARRRHPRTPWGAVIPEPLRKFFRLEESARALRHYHPEYVHGLAQTEDYARALISANTALDARDVDRLVQARMSRQARLYGPRPIELSIVMPEAVVRLPVGGSEVMRRQLLHLIELADLPNIDIRVLPNTATAYASRGLPFSIYTPTAARRTVVYLDNLIDGVWVDDEDRVAKYVAAYDQLQGAALPVEDTVKLLATVALEA